MSIDNKFYTFQTQGGRINPNSDIEKLLKSESLRLTKRLDKYFQEIKLEQNHIVLDAPCGYGNMLYTYSRHNIKSHGYDLDSAQVSIAKYYGLNAETMDILKIQSSSKYIAISSLDFIEHLEKDVALEVLKNFYSFLRPGGLLILRTPCADSPFGLRDFANDPTHKWVGTSGTVSNLLVMTGYCNIEIIEDWPMPNKLRIPRIFLAKVLRSLTRIYLFLIGFGSPTCLSPSMLIVARKPTNLYS